MAIPDRPLNFRPRDMTLDDYAWLSDWLTARSAEGADIRRFCDLLATCSDWTRAELGRVTFSELDQVVRLMAGAADAIPPVSGGNSNSGLMATPETSPAGATS